MLLNRNFLIVLLLGLVLGACFLHRPHGSSLSVDSTNATQASTPDLPGTAAPANGLSVSTGDPADTSERNSAGLYKCASANGVSYSDAPCPEHSKRLAMNRGTITVVRDQGIKQPKFSLPELGPNSAQAQAEAQRLAEIKEKRMDEVIGR